MASNAKAIEALQRGIGKGGVKNPDEAGNAAGHRLPACGQQGRGRQGIQTVKKDATMTRIAKLWLLTLDRR